jgi:hypothetical protein
MGTLAERLEPGAVWQDTGLVLTTSVGTPLDPDNLSKGFVRLCDRAGLGRWHLHTVARRGQGHELEDLRRSLAMLAPGTKATVPSREQAMALVAELAELRDRHGQLLAGLQALVERTDRA